MPYHLDDTICAVASPPGGAARGIVRLAGPGAGQCLRGCFVPAGGAWPDARRPIVCDGQLQLADLPPLPATIYQWPAGRSYTGDLAVEVHTFGAPPLLEALVHQCCAAGARPAEPGEFTLRAFLAGRIDLTQAEAVLGVVEAADRPALATALSQLAGGLAGPLAALRAALVDLLVLLEAGFDFPEEDIRFIAHEEVARQLARAQQELAAVARRMESRGDSSPIARAVLVGWTNTGKSSLFNALAGRGRAIVSDEEGTTRDYLLAELELDGGRVTLVDTAGSEAERPPASPREAAQMLAAEQRRRAELRLLCLDASRPLNPWERDQLSQADPARTLVVLTKADRPLATDYAGPAVATSSRTGAGLDALRAELRRRLAERPAAAEVVPVTAQRCRHAVVRAAESLAAAAAVHTQGWGEELVAADVRTALDALGQVVGAVYTDELLDQIFSRFCIGK